MFWLLLDRFAKKVVLPSDLYESTALTLYISVWYIYLLTLKLNSFNYLHLNNTDHRATVEMHHFRLSGFYFSYYHYSQKVPLSYPIQENESRSVREKEGGHRERERESFGNLIRGSLSKWPRVCVCVCVWVQKKGFQNSTK